MTINFNYLFKKGGKIIIEHHIHNLREILRRIGTFEWYF